MGENDVLNKPETTRDDTFRGDDPPIPSNDGTPAYDEPTDQPDPWAPDIDSAQGVPRRQIEFERTFERNIAPGQSWEDKFKIAQQMARDFGFDPAKYHWKEQSSATDASQPANTGMSENAPRQIMDWASSDESTITALRRELNQHGVTPESLLPNLMRDNRVLALGEGHTNNEPQEKMLIKTMADLKAAGATHLALEISDDHQPALEKFMATGELDPSLPASVTQNPVYVEMMKAARREGLQLVAVDMVHPQNQDTPQRDPYMAHKIDEVLAADRDNKVVFLIGERHIDDRTSMGKPASDQSSAVSYLRDKYDVASVSYENVSPHEWGLRGAFGDLRNPTAVSSLRAPLIANDLDITGNWANKLYDYTIFYPSR